MQTNNKLRKVLKSASERLRKATESKRYGEDILYLIECMRSVAQECDYALAEPVRNCEVGTVEEQAARMKAYCKSRRSFDNQTGTSYGCEGCSGIDIDECALIWAQMPYEVKE